MENLKSGSLWGGAMVAAEGFRGAGPVADGSYLDGAEDWSWRRGLELAH